MNPAGQNGHGNGNGAGKKPGGDPFEDFDALIRDRDDEFDVEFEHPRAQYDPYADFASARSGESGGGSGFGDRGLVEAITRIIEALAGVAGDALAPEARRQLEKTLRDLLEKTGRSGSLMDAFQRHHRDGQGRQVRRRARFAGCPWTSGSHVSRECRDVRRAGRERPVQFPHPAHYQGDAFPVQGDHRLLQFPPQLGHVLLVLRPELQLPFLR